MKGGGGGGNRVCGSPVDDTLNEEAFNFPSREGVFKRASMSTLERTKCASYLTGEKKTSRKRGPKSRSTEPRGEKGRKKAVFVTRTKKRCLEK